METIDKAKIQALLADFTAQREQAIARANALSGAVDALNAVLALKNDEQVSDEPEEKPAE